MSIPERILQGCVRYPNRRPAMGRLQETFEKGRLRGPFDRIVPQPIPERFLELLKELEKCAKSEAGVSSSDDGRQAAGGVGGQESKGGR
jgi:hypothetical protein